MTGQEFKEKAAEVVGICKDMDFMNREIFPYGFKMKVGALVMNWKDYDRSTDDSKAIMRSELKGFLPILESWIRYEQEPLVRVRILTGGKAGEVTELHESSARMFIDSGMAEEVMA